MTPIQNEAVLTANGEFSFERLLPAREVLLEWCITAGTAAVTPGYVNLAGDFAPARNSDGTLPTFGTEGGTCRILLPNSATAVLKVEDASVLDAEADPATVALSMKVCQNLIQN
jgi:hypothetical protein